MLRTNKDKVVKISIQGKIHSPLGGAYRIHHSGEPRILPATGGITYNVRIGDPCFGLAGDHVEPAVSIRNENKAESGALMTFSCVGNTAKVTSGDAKGTTGFVTGMHGGIEHVLIDFTEEEMEKMAIGDSILIKGYGQGLELLDYPDIKLMSIDPDFFEKLPITENNGKIQVPVVAKVPAYLMGSGIGSSSAYTGDYDIMTADEAEIKRLGLDKLKFGDFVLLENCDNSFGRGYLGGAVSIGVVVHSDCIKAGHGPGITTIMTCKKPLIEGVIKADANLVTYRNK